MTSHKPAGVSSNVIRLYVNAVEHIVDEFKRGEISQAEAINQHDHAAALMIGAMRHNFLLRLHNTEALRIERGNSFEQMRES